MTKLQLDASKLLGFRLGSAGKLPDGKPVTLSAASAKIGNKVGAKVGGKVDAKAN